MMVFSRHVGPRVPQTMFGGYSRVRAYFRAYSSLFPLRHSVPIAAWLHITLCLRKTSCFKTSEGSKHDSHIFICGDNDLHDCFKHWSNGLARHLCLKAASKLVKAFEHSGIVISQTAAHAVSFSITRCTALNTRRLRRSET